VEGGGFVNYIFRISLIFVMQTDIGRAAINLNARLCEYSWFRYVGIGDNEIIVYVNKKRFELIRFLVPSVWEDIPVRLQYVSMPQSIFVVE
jgi:hypothetical protein